MSRVNAALSFEEKITAAYMHYVRGLFQEDIAAIYGVNQGRVNEACLTIKQALTPQPKDNRDE